jgi:ferritin
MEQQNKEIFEGKTVSDLAKEIYEKHKEQDSSIKARINQLADMVESPGDAIVIVPMLKGYVDSSLKNDEVLMKMLQIFQKQEERKAAGESDASLLTEKDIAQLFNEVSTYTVSNNSTPQITEEGEIK